MFSSNSNNENNSNPNIQVIDPLTIWLIRISCTLLIIVLFGLIVGLPLAISFSKSLIDNIILSSQEFLQKIIEIYLA